VVVLLTALLAVMVSQVDVVVELTTDLTNRFVQVAQAPKLERAELALVMLAVAQLRTILVAVVVLVRLVKLVLVVKQVMVVLAEILGHHGRARPTQV
jgi:hypothetical protein